MTGAGDLREVINMQIQGETDPSLPDYGSPQAGPWETQWSAPGRIQILRGSEAVMAGRLGGVQTLAITMRWQDAFATVDAAWRAVNGRTGEIYNVRSIEPDERKAFVNILVEKGVAT